MTRTKIRAAALAGLTAGSLMLVASPALAITATGGTFTITVDPTFASQAASAGIDFEAVSPATSSTSNGVTTVTLPVTGGNGDVRRGLGTILLGGSLKVHNSRTDTCLTFSSLNFSYTYGALNGTPSSGGTSPVALADSGGAMTASYTSTTQTFGASALLVDPAGASFVDTNLNTTFFTAGQNTGSMSTTYTYVP